MSVDNRRFLVEKGKNGLVLWRDGQAQMQIVMPSNTNDLIALVCDVVDFVNNQSDSISDFTML
jgi:hypothetical protein